MQKNTKLYLLSGFLGSGKTTFVRQLLDHTGDTTVGIIMNEFGKISIDGPILQRGNLELVELNRGSVFCSCLKLSFVEALIDLSDKELDYVVVESSGLADPSNIGEILECLSNLTTNDYDYCGSITVVDASRFLHEVDTIETIAKQIECADLSIINKMDLVDEGTLSRIEDRVRAINGDTEVLKSSYFKIPMDFWGKDLSGGKYPELKSSLNTPENKPKTISMSFNVTVERDSFEKFLSQVSESTYRIKGFVDMENERTEVQVVGSQIDFHRTDTHLDVPTLVFISKVGPQIIRIVDEAWKTHIGLPMKLAN